MYINAKCPTLKRQGNHTTETKPDQKKKKPNGESTLFFSPAGSQPGWCGPSCWALLESHVAPLQDEGWWHSGHLQLLPLLLPPSLSCAVPLSGYLFFLNFFFFSFSFSSVQFLVLQGWVRGWRRARRRGRAVTPWWWRWGPSSVLPGGPFLWSARLARSSGDRERVTHTLLGHTATPAMLQVLTPLRNGHKWSYPPLHQLMTWKIPLLHLLLLGLRAPLIKLCFPVSIPALEAKQEVEEDLRSFIGKQVKGITSAKLFWDQGSC